MYINEKLPSSIKVPLLPQLHFCRTCFSEQFNTPDIFHFSQKEQIFQPINYWMAICTSRPASLVVVGDILAAPSGWTEVRL